MKERSAVDIFSGAGGLSVGAQWAGIKSALAVELDPFSAETYIKNHPETAVLQQDIKEIDPLSHIAEHPFILFGGPPCQGFSDANTKTRNLDNPNNSLFKEYLRFVEVLQPEWFLFENVKGFKSFHKGSFAKDVENQLAELGYQTNSSVLCASNYGVPQNRYRFFIVGHRKDKGGIKFDFEQIRKKETVSVWDAISDLPSLSNGDKKESENYRDEIKNGFVRLMRQGSESATQNFVSKNSDYVTEYKK